MTKYPGLHSRDMLWLFLFTKKSVNGVFIDCSFQKLVYIYLDILFIIYIIYILYIYYLQFIFAKTPLLIQNIFKNIFHLQIIFG